MVANEDKTLDRQVLWNKSKEAGGDRYLCGAAEQEQKDT